MRARGLLIFAVAVAVALPGFVFAEDPPRSANPPTRLDSILNLREEASGNILYFEESKSRPLSPKRNEPVPRDVTQIGPPPGETPPPASEPHTAPAKEPRAPRPDEEMLWRMLRDQGHDVLLQEIARLRGKHPGWRPPAELVQLAFEARFRERVERAIASSDDVGLLQLAAENEKAFGCDRIDWAWALADAHARAGDAARAAAIAEDLVSRCTVDADRLATLYKARAWLPAAAWRSLLQREAPAARSPAIDEKYRRLVYDARAEHFGEARRVKDPVATELFAALAADIEAFRDPGTATAGGWLHLEASDTVQAAGWFAKALSWDPGATDARRGLALCALREKRFEDAIREAQALPQDTSTSRSTLLQEALLGKAGDAYASARYTETLALLAEAAAHGQLPRHARAMQAWSWLHSGETVHAADAFATLYREAPDAESATGVLQSHLRAGRDAELAELARSDPLRTELRRHQARKSFDEKRFLAARSIEPETYSGRGAVATPQLTPYAAVRDKSGSSGLSQLRLGMYSIELGMPSGVAGEAYLRLDRVSLDSGPLPAKAPVGAALATDYTFGPVTHVTGMQPRFFWRHERDAAWQLDIGITPSGGAVAARPFGRVERQAYAAWGQYTFAGYVEPVRESILSYVGMRDPYSGAEWGRVLRHGLELRGLRLRELPLSVSGRLRIERITGQGVADNSRIQIDAVAGRDLRLPGFDYAVLGLSAGAEHYQKNLGQFTLGHGGYFSPQRYVRAGLAFDFLTKEHRQWIVRGRVSAGRISKTLDAAPFFPLAPDSQCTAQPCVYPSSHEHGTDAGVEASAVFRVSDRMQAGFMFSRSVSPQFTNNVAGVFIRLLWEPSGSALSVDLPSRLATDVSF